MQRQVSPGAVIKNTVLFLELMMLTEKKMESVMDVLNCHNVSVYRDSLSLSHTDTHSNLQHTSSARLLLQIEGGVGGGGHTR